MQTQSDCSARHSLHLPPSSFLLLVAPGGNKCLRVFPACLPFHEKGHRFHVAFTSANIQHHLFVQLQLPVKEGRGRMHCWSQAWPVLAGQAPWSSSSNCRHALHHCHVKLRCVYSAICLCFLNVASGTISLSLTESNKSNQQKVINLRKLNQGIIIIIK